MSRTLTFSIWLVWALTASGAEEQVEPQAVLRKAMANARAAAADGRCFTYFKETIREDTDSAGRVSCRKTKVRTLQSRPVGPADACRWSNNHGINLDEELL